MDLLKQQNTCEIKLPLTEEQSKKFKMKSLEVKPGFDSDTA